MNEEKLEYFKDKLETELKLVEDELKHVGRKNPSNQSDWEGRPADFDVDTADDTEIADKIEEYEENTAVLKNLEIRFNEIKKALKRIEDRTFGVCAVGREIIEEDRLEANPAATTCKRHMK